MYELCSIHVKLIFLYTMFYWIIQITIISIIFICLLHYLIDFYTSILTVPKVKDLVNNPAKKYEAIYNIIAHNTETPSGLKYNESGLLNNPNKDDMKNELKNFLKNQLTLSSSTDVSSSTDISSSTDVSSSTDISTLVSSY